MHTLRLTVSGYQAQLVGYFLNSNLLGDALLHTEADWVVYKTTAMACPMQGQHIHTLLGIWRNEHDSFVQLACHAGSYPGQSSWHSWVPWNTVR